MRRRGRKQKKEGESEREEQRGALYFSIPLIGTTMPLYMPLYIVENSNRNLICQLFLGSGSNY